MKNKVFIFFILCFFASCGNFLEPKSKSEFVPKDASSLSELLLGEAYPRNDRTLSIYLDLLDDDINSSTYQELAEGIDVRRYFGLFTWQPDMYELMEEGGLNDSQYNLYKRYYERLRGVNAVLDYWETVSGTPDDLNNVKAQALALRAFYYFYLVNIYGHPYNDNKEALGVPLKLTSQVEEELPARHTVQEVYRQVEQDLLEAQALYLALPGETQWKDNHRTSLPMVQLLLSRVYLYMENWKEAADYAKKIMDDAHFSLFDLNTITEEKPYAVFHVYSNPETIWGYGSISDFASGTWVLLQGKKEDATKNRPNFFKASESLLATFDETPGDLRKEYYFVPETYQAEDGSYPLQPYGKLEVAEKFGRPQTGGLRYARSFRLSEAYLNYSEAKAMLYKTAGDATARTEAVAALEELRKHRFSGDDYRFTAGNADELVKFVRNERRRELCFETHRWFDLRRWGMPEITHVWNSDLNTASVYTLREKDPAYTLPLPHGAIEANNHLVQNPLASKRTN